MTYYIITGASRGIGEHLARTLASNHATMFLLARSSMDNLVSDVTAKGAKARAISVDLSNPESLSTVIADIFADISETDAERIVLINNAGMLSPMGPVGKYHADDFLTNLQVNFTSAVLLCHLFIQKTQDWNVCKRIVNVSSGAAYRPYEGWAHYCSAKAGLLMFTSCIHEEQKNRAHPVFALSYNPGRTDTQMQAEIRTQKKEDFPFVQNFVEAQQDGALNNPAEVAAHIAQIISSTTFPSGQTISFR